MAFCSNCGNALLGSERFCAQCGTDVSAKPSAAPNPNAPPPPPPMQPVAATPVQYAVPAQSPRGFAVPPGPPAPVPQKHSGMMGTVVVLAIVAGLGYYYYAKSHPGTNPSAAPATTPASQPAAPAAPPPPGQGSGANAALVNQQAFDAHWQEENGFLVLTTAKWTNNSAVALNSAVVQCEQDNAEGTDLSQYRVTLNGPTAANAWSSYSNIQIGAFIASTAKVNCTVVHVKPAS